MLEVRVTLGDPAGRRPGARSAVLLGSLNSLRDPVRGAEQGLCGPRSRCSRSAPDAGALPPRRGLWPGIAPREQRGHLLPAVRPGDPRLREATARLAAEAAEQPPRRPHERALAAAARTRQLPPLTRDSRLLWRRAAARRHGRAAARRH